MTDKPELSEEAVKTLTAILELIEDKQYPAKRNIYDYVTALLPYDLRQEADELGEYFFKKSDEMANRTIETQ